MEIPRLSRQCLEAGRGIDDANRRQAIRHAAGFVVARSATPSTKFFEVPDSFNYGDVNFAIIPPSALHTNDMNLEPGRYGK